MALDLLRSGHVCGNLLGGVLEPSSLNSIATQAQLFLEAGTINEIGKLAGSGRVEHDSLCNSVDQPDQCVIEKVDNFLRRDSGFPSLCASPSLAFLAKLRLEDMISSLQAIGREKLFLHPNNDSQAHSDSYHQHFKFADSSSGGARRPNTSNVYLHPESYDPDFYDDFIYRENTGEWDGIGGDSDDEEEGDSGKNHVKDGDLGSATTDESVIHDLRRATGYLSLREYSRHKHRVPRDCWLTE